MLYRTLKRMIERGQTANLAERLDVFYATGRITDAEYKELAGELLALHPDILCFDEPTSALDPELTGEVLRFPLAPSPSPAGNLRKGKVSNKKPRCGCMWLIQIDSVFAVVADKAMTFGNVSRRPFSAGNIDAGFAIQAMNCFAFQQTDNYLSFVTRRHSNHLRE